MPDHEQLREALLELRTLREREARSHRDTLALLKALECIRSGLPRAEAVRSLLGVVAKDMDCDLAMILLSEDERSSVLFSSDPALEGLSWDVVGVPVRRGRRIIDVRELISSDRDVPEPLRVYRGLLSEPIDLRTDGVTVMVCLSKSPGHYDKADSVLLARLCGVASQALAGLELEERNAFLAKMVEGGSAGVAIGEPRGDELTLIYANKAFESLTGFSPDRALGHGVEVLHDEPEGSESLAALRRAIRDRTGGVFVLSRHRPDGAQGWTEVTLVPVEEPDGGVSHLVVTQVDVTNRVEAMRERDIATHRLEAALTSTSTGILALAEDGKVIYANRVFEEFVSMFGIEWGVGWYFQDIWKRYHQMRGETEAVAAQKAESYMKRLTSEARSLERRLPDGRLLLVNERPIPDGGSVIVATDVTALKAAENTLRQRAAAIENVQDGIAIADQHGRVAYANPSLVRLWRAEVEADVLGRRWTSFYAPDEARELAHRLELQDGEASVRDDIHFAGGGEDDLHSLSLNVVEDLGIVIAVRDMSERIRSDRARARLRDRLQAAKRQEALGQMAAGLAHDFNNLLSAITGSATLLAEDPDSSDAIRRSARRIAAAGYQAADLVDKLLDLGRGEFQKERVDLAILLRETADSVRSGLRGNVRLSVDIGDHPVETYASRTDILQLTLNLLINAVDALPAAGGEVSLSLDKSPARPVDEDLILGRVHPDLNYVAVSVEDSGAGIPPDRLGRIFDAYFSTKGEKGTGLGLAVVASVVKANDAGVAVHSEPGRGSRFTVYWPLAEKGASAERPATPGAHDLSGQLVIVVDDEPEVAHVIASLLGQAGAEVSTLTDPAMAFEAIADDPEAWACLVTDFDMPGMNGGELVEKVSGIAPTTGLVVVTALARRLADKRIDKSGVDAVLAKPVEPAALISAVGEAIARRRKAEEYST